MLVVVVLTIFWPIGCIHGSYGRYVYCECPLTTPRKVSPLTSAQGAIGVLDRTEMDHFATLFVAYQKRGKSEDQDGEINLRDSLS